MKIRKVKPNEWKQLQILNNEVFVDNAKYDPDIIEDWAFSEAGEHYFKALVIDDTSICLVAEDDTGKLVGYIAASPKTISYRKSRYLEVDNMGVLPKYRSQGVGKELMDACKQWAQKHNFQRLFVNSYANNKKAIHFYIKNGFEVIDVSLEQDL